MACSFCVFGRSIPPPSHGLVADARSCRTFQQLDIVASRLRVLTSSSLLVSECGPSTSHTPRPHSLLFRLLVRTSTRSAPFDLRVRPEARCNHRRPEPDCDALRPEGLAICDLQTGIPPFRSQESDAGSLPNVAATPRDRYYKFRRLHTTVSTFISLHIAWEGIPQSTALCDAIPGSLVAFARFLAWQPGISHAPRIIAPSTTTPAPTASSSPAPTTTDAIPSCAEFNNTQRYNAASIWPHWTPMRPQRDGLGRRNYAGDNMTDTRCV